MKPPASGRGRGVPAFALYGEDSAPQAEMLHVEDIHARSSLYQWEIRPHVHQGLYQMVWVASGNAEVTLDEWHKFAIGPAAIVIPPGIVHGFRFAPATQGQVLSFSAQLLVEGELSAVGDALRRLFAAPQVLPFDTGDPDTLRQSALFRELVAEFAMPGAEQSPVPGWLARAAVWRLARGAARQMPGGTEQGPAGRDHQALYTRFVLLVEQHFLDHWPVARYASRLGLSEPRLNRLVRAEKGMTALDLIHQRLTREACRRLVYVAVPVVNLAQELGFEDPAYFCRFFKRRTGLSPKRYRDQHRTSTAGASA